MRTRNGGFTLVEVVIVTMIGIILVGLVVPAFSTVQSSASLRGAKHMYATLHQRARSRSIELGQTTFLIVSAVGDSAYIWSDGAVSDVTHFGREMNVDLRSSPQAFFMCMTPRGYADPDCGAWGQFFSATTDSIVDLEFWLNSDSTSLTILPMGQLVGQ